MPGWPAKPLDAWIKAGRVPWDESKHKRDGGRFATTEGAGKSEGGGEMTALHGKAWMESEGWQEGGFGGEGITREMPDGTIQRAWVGTGHNVLTAIYDEDRNLQDIQNHGRVGGTGAVESAARERFGGQAEATEPPTPGGGGEDVGPADQDAAMPAGKPAGRRMKDGTVAIDHAAYQEWIKTQPPENIDYIVGDAMAAIKANPTSHKAGYYADEINYAAMELKRRATGGE